MKKLLAVWPFAVLPIGLVVLFLDTFVSLNASWTQWDQAYSHGYLLVGFLIYAVGRECLYTPMQPKDKWRWVACGSLFLSVGAWYAGIVVQVLVLEQLALLAIAWSLGWVIAGSVFAFRTILPFALASLAFPMWDILTSTLQDITVYIVTFAVQAFGITSYIVDNVIELPFGVLVVESGCAGLNFFIVSLAFGGIYSYLNLVRPVSIAKCMVIMVALGLIANWVRVFLLVLIGYYSKMQSEIVYDHGTFGWVIFGVALVCFLLLFRLQERGRREVDETIFAAAYRPSSAFFVGLAILLAGVFWAKHISTQKNGGSVDRQLSGGFHLLPAYTVPWQPHYEGYDQASHWRSTESDVQLYLSIYTYLEQYQGKELVYYKNSIADKYQLKRVDSKSNRLTNTNIAIVQNKGKATLVMWRYRVGAWYTQSEWAAKLLQLPMSFTSDNIAELVVFSLPCIESAFECQAEIEWAQQEQNAAALQQLYERILETPKG